MGFSQADYQELLRLQGKLDTIRFGPRAYKPPPVQLAFFPQPRSRSNHARRSASSRPTTRGTSGTGSDFGDQRHEFLGNRHSSAV